MTDPGPALSFPALLSSSTTFCCLGVFAQRSDFLGEVLVSWFKSDHSVWSYVTHGRLWHLCQGKGGCTDYSQLFPVSFFSGQLDTWMGSWLPLTFQLECVSLSSRHPPCMVTIPTGLSSFSWTGGRSIPFPSLRQPGESHGIFHRVRNLGLQQYLPSLPLVFCLPGVGRTGMHEMLQNSFCFQVDQQVKSHSHLLYYAYIYVYI